MNELNGSIKYAAAYNPDEQLKFGFLRQHSIFLVRLCSLLDALVIFGTLLWTFWLYDRQWLPQHLAVGLLAALVFQIIATLMDLYRSWRVSRLRYEILKILLSWSISIIVLTFMLFFVQDENVPDNRALVTWFALAFVVMTVVHCTARMITRYARAFGYDVRKVAFIGANGIASQMARIYASHPWMGMKTVGIYDNRKVREQDRIAVGEGELAGSVDTLLELARNGEVDVVYICLPLAAEKRIKLFIDQFSDTTVSIYYCPSFLNFDLLQSRWDQVFGQPVISIVESPFVDHQRYLKRLEDIVFVLVSLPVLIPLIAVIALMIKLSSRGPVFFKQNRYGMNGKSFKMWKFRTMYADRCNEPYLQVTRNDPRITPLGAFLRRTSLDEIPQFINVLLGDMSVVGPRPHPDVVNEELRKRIYRYMLRHKLKPGITGLAQVNGYRGETESLEKMAQRIQYDLQYIRNWSLILDIRILIKTVFNLGGTHVY